METNNLINALKGILTEPHGCPMCDSGKLRDPNKKHWPDCPFLIATSLLNKEVETLQEKELRLGQRVTEIYDERDAYYEVIDRCHNGAGITELMERFAIDIKPPTTLSKSLEFKPQHTNENIAQKEELLRGLAVDGFERRLYSHEDVLNVMEEYHHLKSQPKGEDAVEAIAFANSIIYKQS